jgi:hypothetical protein
MTARWCWAAALVVALGGLGAECQVPPPSPPSETGGTPYPDAGVDTGGITNTGGAVSRSPCELACDNMRLRKCPGFTGEKSPAGTSCEVTCEDTEASGVARFCPNEVAAAQDCLAMEKAFSACEDLD